MLVSAQETMSVNAMSLYQ